MHSSCRTVWCLAAVATLSVAAGVATLASDFLTEGVDNARTGWVRDEKVFTTSNVAQSKLLWKVKLESTPRAMHNLFAPLVAERVTTAEGPRELAVVAGVSDDLFGIDVASGKQIWHRHFDSTLANPGGTNDTLCPGGQTDVPTMAQTSPGKYTIYAVSWDGRLRQVNLADGQDVAPPEKFIPGGGKPYALNLHDGVIYTATAQGCGGLTNAFYSFDLASRRASAFIPAGGGLWGRRGAAIDPEGARLSSAPAMRSSIRRPSVSAMRIVGVKLDTNKQLQLVDFFGAPNANWLWRRDLDVNTTPVAIDAQRTQVPGRHEQGVPACGCSIARARRRGSPDDAAHDPAHLQRRARVRCQRDLGSARCMAGPERHRVGAGAVLGTREQGVPRAGRARRGRPAAASPPSKCSSVQAAGSSRRRGCRATWTSPKKP